MRTKESIKRLNFAVELLKSVLLALLVVSMISLVILYIRGTHVYESVSAQNDVQKSFDKLWNVEGGAAAEGLDGNRLIPEFIGYRQPGNAPAGTVGNQEASADLYELIKPCLLELFGSDTTCKKLSAQNGSERFLRAISGDEFVYLRYHVPVLYQLIYAYASDKLIISEGDVAVGDDGSISAYISELVIVPDTEYAAAAHRYIAYAIDASGDSEFRPNDYIVTSAFYTSKLADAGATAGAISFRFAEDTMLPATQPILDTELSYTVIAASPATVSDEAILTPLLRLFGYNPDKLNYYVDDTGASVYVDTNSRLRVDESAISFLTSDAFTDSKRGITIDSLLGYSSEDTLNLFDQLTAVDNLIRRLREISPSLIGGEASLCLGNVYTENAHLVIEYVPVYNNIRIADTVVLRAVLTQDTICEVELHPISVTAADETANALQPEFMLRKLIDLGKLSPTVKTKGLRLLYSGTNAAWSVILK